MNGHKIISILASVFGSIFIMAVPAYMAYRYTSPVPSVTYAALLAFLMILRYRTVSKSTNDSQSLASEYCHLVSSLIAYIPVIVAVHTFMPESMLAKGVVGAIGIPFLYITFNAMD